MVTTRLTNLRFLRFHQPQPIPLFSDEECLQLFRDVIGGGEVVPFEAECRRLFTRLGHLPIAVSISAALIREDVRYTNPGLAQNLPDDTTALIRSAIGAPDSVSRQLLGAMSACASEGFFFELAVAVAGLDEVAALTALQQLTARSLTEELSRSDRRYRLHALVRAAANGAAFARQHAEVVRDRFKNWETNWRRCEQGLPDFRLAFEGASTLRFHGLALSRAPVRT
jgi:hypothetical protein